MFLSAKERHRRYSRVVAALLVHRPEHGDELVQFSWKNFVDLGAIFTKYPDLSFLKAAEVRGMLPCVTQLCTEFDDGSDNWKHQLKLCKNLCTVYDVIHNGGIMPTDGEFQILEKAGRNVLLHYTYLSRLALDNSKLMWNVIPKHHYFWHLVQNAKWTNPRFTWCYGGEDLVGKISNLGMSCTRGTAVFHVPAKLMEKYRLAVHVEWTRG